MDANLALQELFSTRGMRAIRDNISSFDTLVIHRTNINYFNCIRDFGLLPRYIEFGTFCDERIKQLVPGRDIICFRPELSNLKPQGSSPYGSTLFDIAIKTSDLPDMLGMDWSYDGQFEFFLNRIYSADKFDDMIAIACNIIRDLGSFVSYARVDPDKLMVQLRTSDPISPIEWAPIVSCDVGQIATITN